jgi:hypothetical protein
LYAQLRSREPNIAKQDKKVIAAQELVEAQDKP